MTHFIRLTRPWGDPLYVDPRQITSVGVPFGVGTRPDEQTEITYMPRGYAAVTEPIGVVLQLIRKAEAE